MTEQEMNRAVQYVVARTSYGRDTVDRIVRTGFSEFQTLATRSTCQFEREHLLEYVCRWTMAKTRQPEPLVREVLGCAGRWLDQLYEQLVETQADVES